MFARYIAKLFGTHTRTPIRNANRCRLHMEGLEAREVPAAIIWSGNGIDGEFNNPDNWNGGVVPQINDDVIFDGNSVNPNSDKDCVNMGLIYGTIPGPGPGPGGSVSTGHLKTLSIVGNYSKTVSLSAEQEFETFVLDAPQGGAIAQPNINFATDIAVTKNFTWHAGTLNNSGYDARVVIEGAKADIIPTNEGTVTTGSTLVLKAVETVAGVFRSSVGTINPGIVNFAGGGGIVVGNECLVNLFPAPATTKGEIFLSLSGTNKEERRVLIQAGGKVLATTKRQPGDTTSLGVVESPLPFRNAGGEFRIDKTTKVFLKGNVDPQIPNSASYHQDDGKLVIENTSTLRVENGASFTGGKIQTIMRIPDFEAELPPATIDGNVTNAGASVEIHATTNKILSLDKGVLNIIGDYRWQKGEFIPAVYILFPEDGDCDRIDVSGTITVGADVKITPNAVSTPAPPRSIVGKTWAILTAGDRIIGVPPTLPAPDVWGMVPNNAVTRWSLKGLKDV